MATHYVYFHSEKETEEFTHYFFVRTSASPVQVERGDTVVFSYQNTGNASGTALVGSFASSQWTSSSSVSVSKGNSTSKVIKADAALGFDTITFTRSGYTSASVSIEIIDNTDTTPDNFDFISLTKQNPNVLIESNQITVSGITEPVAISVSNGGKYAKNGANSWVSSGMVADGDTIKVRNTTALAYATSVATTVTIGGVSDVWTITTKNSPGSGQVIPAPFTSLPVSLLALKAFFGGDGKLKSYLRGGVNVPDISQNNAIAKTLPLSLASFAGAHTALYFSQSPGGKQRLYHTNVSAQTANLTWFKGTDFDVGYGILTGLVHVKYVVTRLTGDTPVISSPGTPGTYSLNNSSVTLSLTKPQGNESYHTGYVTIYVIHPNYPALVLSTTASYEIQFASLNQLRGKQNEYTNIFKSRFY